MIMKILLLIQKSPSKARCRQTIVVFSRYIQGVLRVSATSGKLGYFYSHLSLETVFAGLTLTQNCHINKYKYIFFLENWVPLWVLNWVPLSLSFNHSMLERLSLPTLQRIRNNLEVQPQRLMLKKTFHLFFFSIGKI